MNNIKYDKNSGILNFFGIKFYNWNFKKILRILYLNGGYMVAPSASALSSVLYNKKYYFSLKKSSVAIFDSGFFCLLLKFYGINVKKFSGFLFLHKFLKIKLFKNKKIFLVNPSKDEDKLNIKLLKKYRFKKIDSYISPIYKSNLSDNLMLKKIVKYKPCLIIINLGGEKQELIANFICKNIKFKTVILCTGAAIAFITKSQAPINVLIDKFYLGWLFRVIFDPHKFLFRVLFSFKLIKLFFLKSRKLTYI
jgi:N-acetylglucosaminyldiphosphoundecaprenol N-acetyl-beta-D-mannosaminyltransferase